MQMAADLRQDGTIEWKPGPAGNLVWIRVQLQRRSRTTHAVHLGTGLIACEIGHANLDGQTPMRLRMMEADDRTVPRCPRCVAVVYGHAPTD